MAFSDQEQPVKRSSLSAYGQPQIHLQQGLLKMYRCIFPASFAGQEALSGHHQQKELYESSVQPIIYTNYHPCIISFFV